MKIVRWSTRLFLYLIIASGFSFQAFQICDDYFQYKTSTVISILNDPPRKYIPSIIVCNPEHIRPKSVTIDKLFNETLEEKIVKLEVQVMEHCSRDYFATKQTLI